MIFIIGLISLIGTFAVDSTITEGNSSKADYLFNIVLGDRTNREVVIPTYDSKIVDIKISNPNDFNMSYLLYFEGINSDISIINISDTEASGILNSSNTNLIKVFIQNNSSTDVIVSIKDLVGFENETISLPSNATAIHKGVYYKAIVKSNYGKVKPNIKLSTSNGIVKYTIVPNTGYQYKSNTCNGKEHAYIVPYTGTYRLETWGAQGGVKIAGGTSTTGYGGYSVGNINLVKDTSLYVNVGGAGLTTSSASTILAGGYNGGGKGYSYSDNRGGASGGGATQTGGGVGNYDGTFGQGGNCESNDCAGSGKGGGACGSSSTSYGNRGSGASGGSGIVMIRNTR